MDITKQYIDDGLDDIDHFIRPLIKTSVAMKDWKTFLNISEVANKNKELDSIDIFHDYSEVPKRLSVIGKHLIKKSLYPPNKNISVLCMMMSVFSDECYPGGMCTLRAA